MTPATRAPTSCSTCSIGTSSPTTPSWYVSCPSPPPVPCPNFPSLTSLRPTAQRELDTQRPPWVSVGAACGLGADGRQVCVAAAGPQHLRRAVCEGPLVLQCLLPESPLHVGGASLGEAATGMVAVTEAPSPCQDRVPWWVMGCPRVLVGEKPEGLHHLKPLLSLSHLCGSELCLPQAGRPSSGSSSCLALPRSALSSCPCQPLGTWVGGGCQVVEDNHLCSYVTLGSQWLEAWSSLAFLLISEPMFSEVKSSEFHPSHRPAGWGVCWVAAEAPCCPQGSRELGRSQTAISHAGSPLTSHRAVATNTDDPMTVQGLGLGLGHAQGRWETRSGSTVLFGVS